MIFDFLDIKIIQWDKSIVWKKNLLLFANKLGLDPNINTQMKYNNTKNLMGNHYWLKLHTCPHLDQDSWPPHFLYGYS